MVSIRSYRLGNKILSKELSKEHQQLLKPLLESLIINGISSKYTRAEREYIFACISKKNDCAYCYHMHKKFAENNGITKEQKENIHGILEKDLDLETSIIVHFSTLANKFVEFNER